MLIAVIILSVLLATTVWLLIIQFRKSEKLMAFLELYVRMLSVISLRTDRAYKRIKEVDRLGSFEADDETGYIFQEIKAATTDLDEFVKKYITNDTEEKKSEKE